jgi:hypothetical protein
MPADQPQFAFAVLYEGDVGSNVHGGTVAAPMIAQIFKQVYKDAPVSARRQYLPARPIDRATHRVPPEEEEESD